MLPLLLVEQPVERLERHRPVVPVAHQRSGRRLGRRLAARLQQFAVDLVGYVDTPFRSVSRYTTEGGPPLGPRLLAPTHDCGACELSRPPEASAALALLGRIRPCVVVIVARVVAVGQRPSAPEVQEGLVSSS